MKFFAGALIAVACLVAGCAPKYFVLDTASDTVYEYQNDYYVSKIDTFVELHYQFWSLNGSLWLSALNNTDKLMFIILDSTYMTFNGKREYFDFLSDWPDYSVQLSRIPNLTDYDFNKIMPLIPGQWKGFLSDPLALPVKQVDELDPVTEYTKSNSPWNLNVQVCFYEGGNAFTPICKNDTIWVEAITPVDAGTLRSLGRDKNYMKADKFYITNSLTWGN